jgi:hypothetical protein
MSRSLLLPKFSPPRRAGLYLVKALLPLFALALLFLPISSWAGGWVITYASSGSSSASTIIPFGISSPRITPWPATSNSQGASGGSYGCNASTNGSITATLTWQPAYGQTMATDPPPTKPVSIKEVAVAQENTGGWHGSGSAPAPAGSAGDG